MKVLIKALSFVLPISIIGANPVTTEIVNVRFVKRDLSKSDNKSYSNQGLNYNEGWNEDIFIKIANYFTNKNALIKLKVWHDNGNIYYKFNLNSLTLVK